MGKLTVIQTKKPENVGKTYYLQDGRLMKQAVADVWEGIARTVDVPDAATMAKLLHKVTSSTDLVIVNGVFRGVGDDVFVIVTGRRFRQIVEADGEDFQAVLATGTVYTIKTGKNAGHKVAARLKVLQDPSGWLLLDADEPVGFPDQWRGLSCQQRLELLEPVAPGISTAERVELLGSSARVVRDGEATGAASHGWIVVDNPGDVARAATALIVHAVAKDIYFESPRFSRETGEVIGAQARTSIDLAPWHRGRLNFDSKPTVTADGYVVADPGITIVNAGGGPFHPSGVAQVKAKQTRAFKAKTGLTIAINNRETGPMATIYGQLTMDTPIESKGTTKTLRVWMEAMFETGDTKLRCEAPFRDSQSEAAFVGFKRDGEPFLYDIGVAVQYRLATDFDDGETVDDDQAFEDIEADTIEIEADVSSIADPEETPDDFATEEPGDDRTVADPEDGHADNNSGAVLAVVAGAEQDDAKVEDEDQDDTVEVDPNAPLTPDDVKQADIATSEGVAIVDRYREQQLKKLNKAIGYVVIEGKGVIIRVGYNGIQELGIQFIGIDAERIRLANRLIPYVSGTKEPVLKWTKIFPWRLEWDGRRTYDGIVFNPKREVKAERRLPPFHKSGLAPLDLFTGNAWAAAPGDCKTILQHIHDVLCGGDMEGTRYVLDWLARMVQQPEALAETVLVFRAGQGIGKGTVTNIFRRYFGVHGLEITNDKELLGFNDHLATSVFISLNEAVWGGNKQAEGKFKSLITEREITVERKYLPIFKIRNHTHLVVSSNSDWCVPIGHDDRRFAVMKPSAERRGDMEYFNYLNKVIMGGGDRALIHYLLSRDISKFNPRVLPTVAGPIKLEQKLRSANTVAKWLMGVLQDGGLMINEEDIHSNATNRVFVDIGMGVIVKASLHAEYVAAVRGEHPEQMELFSKKMKEILGAAVDVTKKATNGYRPVFRRGYRVPCYTFNDLAQLRIAFGKYMGEAVEWDA